ncbi:MAG: molybdenum cofactor synthesis domain-containing protein [Pseudomonadota bacterium]
MTMGLIPPPLRNDCFAMPQGAFWTPVDAALAHLQANLQPVTGVESVTVGDGVGRVLAGPAIALRAHPPAPNAAVDGYVLKGPVSDGPHEVPLTNGRAAAGVPFASTVPDGHALRILTGADLPDGADTVILQEDVTTNGAAIAFHGPLKQGANARAAGEDMKKGQQVFGARHQLTVPDIATLSAVGVGKINVRKQLRVGVLSTGDELIAPGKIARPGHIYDANRAMLLAAIRNWGHAAVDLGIAPDDREVIRGTLDAAVETCDVILTTGGASAGEEDHMSALLENTGSLALWRIAMKPGRPLALGLWQKKPIFGLPGNPVAACVCALIFARPSLSLMAGGNWLYPVGYQLPAAFTKSKKEGRREYLRARLTETGGVEVFPSEGSGRVSGLSWATGLVELPDAASHITPGTAVRFLPFAELGI